MGLAFLAAALPQYLFVISAIKTKPEVIAILGAAELVVAMLSCSLLLDTALTRLDITAMLLVLWRFVYDTQSLLYNLSLYYWSSKQI